MRKRASLAVYEGGGACCVRACVRVNMHCQLLPPCSDASEVAVCVASVELSAAGSELSVVRFRSVTLRNEAAYLRCAGLLSWRAKGECGKFV